MTDILLPVRLEDAASDTEPIVSAGWLYRVRPGKDYVNGSGETVLAEWPARGGWKAFNGAVATLKLDPLPADNPYYLEIQGPPDPTTSNSKPVRRSEFRQVVAGTTNGTSWYALTRVSGPGPDATVFGTSGYDQLVTQIAGLQSQINSIVVSGGGASNLAGISDMSANARTFNAAANYAAMRTALQVAPLADPAFTGNPTAPTPTAGDNDTSIATTAFVTALLGSGTVTTNSPTFTGTTDLVNLDVSGTAVFGGSMTIPDGALSIADTSGLQAALDAKLPIPTGTMYAVQVFETADPNAARPATTGNTQIWWDLGPNAPTGPINMAAHDKWIG